MTQRELISMKKFYCKCIIFERNGCHYCHMLKIICGRVDFEEIMYRIYRRFKDSETPRRCPLCFKKDREDSVESPDGENMEVKYKASIYNIMLTMLSFLIFINYFY